MISVENDKAVIEVKRQQGCHSCELNGVCGTGSLGRLLGLKQKPISVINHLSLKKGDKVLVTLPDSTLMLSALMVYIMPLCLMFFCAIGASIVFGDQDLVTIVAAITGLFSGLKMASLLSSHTFKDTLQPHVVRQIW